MAKAPVSVQSAADGTVTVACKLPHGLVLQLQETYEEQEPVMGGGTRTVTRHRRVGETVTIKGFARPVDQPFDAFYADGYALTPGVKASFFEEWLAQNKDYLPVKRGLIFAAAKQEDAVSRAREMEKEKSGFEPVDPDDLPAEFKGQIEKGVAAA